MKKALIHSHINFYQSALNIIQQIIYITLNFIIIFGEKTHDYFFLSTSKEKGENYVDSLH